MRTVSGLELPQSEIRRRIDACMNMDRRRLLARLRALESTRAFRRGQDDGLRLRADLARAEAAVEARRRSIPALRYPGDLPVSARRGEIAAAIREHPVIVVCGETGSGKTTQLPKICLEAGRGIRGIIGHTQPRRIAARSVAERISEELGVRLGAEVGYKVRFGDHTGPGTLVKVMTDGVLLAETQADRHLDRYDTLIIDEAHERSLNIDFLLGLLRTLLPRRPDLKVVITSATIDPERFSRHFAQAGRPAPIIMVSGRTYPVEVRYRPPADEDDADGETAFLNAIDELASESSGDLLAFFSGEREIREAAESLRKHHVPGAPGTSVLPLYAKLSAAEQHRVFEPHPGRRIVLATNVAETSLTVPGIRCVVDTGLARISRYSTRTRVQRLEVEPISRASAEQRKGRCGRLGPGVCIRLYAEADFLARPEFTEPEILRTNLASVILQMKSLRLGRVEDFPFLEAPDSRLIKDGYDTLAELGALDAHGELTPVGHSLARLPIDPRIGRMVLASGAEGCLVEMLVIAAFLSVQDPRERPLDAHQAADEKHAEFRDPQSDFMTILKMWEAVREGRRHLSGSRFRRWCRDRFVSYMRVREWEDVHRQLSELAGSMGIRTNPRPAGPDSVHRAVLAGLLASVGRRGAQGEYAGPRSVKFRVFPGSALFRKGPEWIVAAELVRTTQLYARTAGPVRPEWIEELGGHLLKRSYADPHWSAEAGKAFAFERASLHGLDIVERRRVPLGPVDPAKAGELFIHHALVEGEARIDAPFLRHNTALAADVRTMESRARREDLLADAAARFAFYDRLLPRDAWSVPLFEAWRRDRERGNPKALFMSMSDLLSPGVTPPTREQFPDRVRLGSLEAPLKYALKPGAEEDGMTAVIPVEALAGIEADSLGWLVPGLIRDKVEAMIKGLPKQTRRLLPGAATLAQGFERSGPAREGDIATAVSRYVERAAGVPVPVGELRDAPLPDHLRMRVEVVGEKGEVLAAGRDLAEIKARLGGRVRQAVLRAGEKDFQRDGLRDWDFGGLPEFAEVRRAGVVVRAFPAIIDQGRAVGIRLMESQSAAAWATRRGLRRLFSLVSDDLDRHARHVPGADRAAASLAAIGPRPTVQAQVRDLVADRAFLRSPVLPRTRAEFDAALIAGGAVLSGAIAEAGGLCARIGAAYLAARLLVEREAPPRFAGVYADVREQLAVLCPPDFLVATDWDRLAHVPRYLGGIEARLRKLPGGGLARDEKNAALLEPWWRVFAARHANDPEAVIREPAFAAYRWMLEEMRISLFAQELRTPEPVSIKRLESQWAAVVKAAGR